MVSIHIVPVIVCLIIKVISSTFRFKCGAESVILLKVVERPRPRYTIQYPTLE